MTSTAATADLPPASGRHGIRPSADVRWSHVPAYVATRAAAMTYNALPDASARRLARSVGRATYRVDAKHRRRATDTIATCFEHWSTKQVAHVAGESFEHLLELVSEIIRLPHLINPSNWTGRVRPRIDDHFESLIDLASSGRPLIMLTGHLGNWELLGCTLALAGYPIQGLARPLDNPLTNRWLVGIRENLGMGVLDKFDAGRGMFDYLRAGKHVAFVADQNAGPRGLFVPFFGRLASTYRSVASLARRTDTPIVCGGAHRVASGKGQWHYVIKAQDVIFPEQWLDRPDPEYYITARYTRAIEQLIRDCPQQYIWFYRRWKTRPPHELAGEPMPADLRIKLESLPWMDQTQIDALEKASR